jgi:ribosomal protein S3
MEKNKLIDSQNQTATLTKLAIICTAKKFSNNYKGILLKFSGRLKGSQRDKKMRLSHGCVATQTFRSSINFSKKQIFTKWGTLGSSIFISR